MGVASFYAGRCVFSGAATPSVTRRHCGTVLLVGGSCHTTPSLINCVGIRKNVLQPQPVVGMRCGIAQVFALHRNVFWLKHLLEPKWPTCNNIFPHTKRKQPPTLHALPGARCVCCFSVGWGICVCVCVGSAGASVSLLGRFAVWLSFMSCEVRPCGGDLTFCVCQASG